MQPGASGLRAGEQAGIVIIHQELALIPELSITENIFLGEEKTARGTLDKRSMRKAARALVEEFSLDIDVDRKLGDYPVATRQLLEIAVATHRKCRYLLLDAIGAAVWAGGISLLAYSLGNAMGGLLEELRNYQVILLAAAMMGLYAMAFYYLQRWLQRQPAARRGGAAR